MDFRTARSALNRTLTPTAAERAARERYGTEHGGGRTETRMTALLRVIDAERQLVNQGREIADLQEVQLQMVNHLYELQQQSTRQAPHAYQSAASSVPSPYASPSTTRKRWREQENGSSKQRPNRMWRQRGRRWSAAHKRGDSISKPVSSTQDASGSGRASCATSATTAPATSSQGDPRSGSGHTAQRRTPESVVHGQPETSAMRRDVEGAVAAYLSQL